MAIKFAAPSPAALSLFKALGAEESPAVMDMEAADLAEHSPSTQQPLGYDLTIKRKRNQALLRQMLIDSGLGDLAQHANIRQHGGYRPSRGGDDEY